MNAYQKAGAAIRQLRLDSQLTFREYCIKYGVDGVLQGQIELGRFKIISEDPLLMDCKKRLEEEVNE